jgi:xanthine dehydrogenase YagT iron-sulfur-binding subunit
VRRLHRDRERTPGERVLDPGGDRRRRSGDHCRGLARPDGRLHAVQAAFLEHDAFQCGYCTPGQLCSAAALLDELALGEPSAVTPAVERVADIVLTDDEIRERMSGNLCRCGAYTNIVAAVRAAARAQNAHGRVR